MISNLQTYREEREQSREEAGRGAGGQMLALAIREGAKPYLILATCKGTGVGSMPTPWQEPLTASHMGSQARRAWLPANAAENCFHETCQGPWAPRPWDRTGNWCGPPSCHVEAQMDGGGRNQKRAREPQRTRDKSHQMAGQ